MNTEIWTVYHRVLPRKPYYSSHGRIRKVVGSVCGGGGGDEKSCWGGGGGGGLRFEECSTLDNFNKAGLRM